MQIKWNIYYHTLAKSLNDIVRTAGAISREYLFFFFCQKETKLIAIYF